MNENKTNINWVYCYISKKDKTKILAPEDIYYKNIYLIAVIIFTIIMFVF